MGATKRKTWTIHRYIEAPGEPSPVLAWLRAAAEAEAAAEEAGGAPAGDEDTGDDDAEV